MKKKMKLSYKAVLSLMLSAVLFCMPAVGFAMNGNYASEVHAEDSTGESETATEGKQSRRQKAVQSRKRRVRYQGMMYRSRYTPVRINAVLTIMTITVRSVPGITKNVLIKSLMLP